MKQQQQKQCNVRQQQQFPQQQQQQQQSKNHKTGLKDLDLKHFLVLCIKPNKNNNKQKQQQLTDCVCMSTCVCVCEFAYVCSEIFCTQLCVCACVCLFVLCVWQLCMRRRPCKLAHVCCPSFLFFLICQCQFCFLFLYFLAGWFCAPLLLQFCSTMQQQETKKKLNKIKTNLNLGKQIESKSGAFQIATANFIKSCAEFWQTNLKGFLLIGECFIG